MRVRRAILLLTTLTSVFGCVPKGGGAASPGGGSAPAMTGGGSHNLLKNASFDAGTSLPWMTSFTEPASGEASVQDGMLCLRVDHKGTNRWDAQVRHREMTIQKGHTYSIRFKAKADKPMRMRPKIGMSGPPYAEYWSATLEIGTSPQTYESTFTMGADDDPTAELAFHLAGELAPEVPYTLCLDDVVLADPQFTQKASAELVPVPNVLVNQIGYFPKLAKLATLKSDAEAPLEWELVGADGEVALSGKTAPAGHDAESGDPVHVIDFSAFQQPGSGYTLRVGDETSFPFDVGDDLYSELKYDALAYFYHNRSGIEIKAEYVGDPKWARGAGHLSDKSVSCAPNTGCSYSLDVSGGWYDAGDHGKYVVNGGISVWTLLNQYERAKHLGGAIGDFSDGKLKIPESKNRVPDLLDEARWELEFLLKMQVPDGQPKAGMAHHKMHDESWTALGMVAPAESGLKRFLRPPSTAATLNLAAVGAMCARIYKPFDGAFANKCLAAAERAWNAAKQNPAVFAPASDSKGGGPYDDAHVKDDFYWAAAELYATTKKPEYRAFVEKSPYMKKLSMDAGGAPSSMNWGVTDALGSISLAVVPGGIDAAAQKQLRDHIVAAADVYLGFIDEQGYRVPFGADSSGKYPWGSNSFVLNNMIILALAHDFTKDKKYLNGVVAGMNYLLGNNPMGQSYVSGYGDNPLRNPHHRFWSHQVNQKFPDAPPGAVSGGPNSSLQDPYAKAAGLQGCAPQKCFVDHIEAWSVNEITINWNAPFAWLAAYLDEQGPKAK
jgi:endoglucanase